MLALVLAACTPSAKTLDTGSAPTDTASPDSADSGDDSGATDSGETDTRAGWPAEIPECASITTPFPLADLSDVEAAWASRPRYEPLVGALRHATEAAEATGCPAHVDDRCTGPGESFTGGCAVGDVVATGVATGSGCEDGGSWTWDAFSVQGADWMLALEGTYDATMNGDEWLTWDASITTHAVCDDATCDGAWVWEGESFYSGIEQWRHQRVDAAPEGEPRSGEFCLDEEIASVEACPDEGIGWTVLQGDHVAVALWDGDVACDGCARLFIDEVEVGSWCR